MGEMEEGSGQDLERREILRTSASRVAQNTTCIKREKEAGDEERRMWWSRIGRTRWWQRARRRGQERKGAKGNCRSLTHGAYTRGAGARPRKRQTDGFTYL